MVDKRHPLYALSKHMPDKPDAMAQVEQAFMAACNEFINRFSMAPDKLKMRLSAGLAEYPDDDTALLSAEAPRNMLRNTVFPRRAQDRRPPDAADAKIQAFSDFAQGLLGRQDVDAASKFLNKTRNSDGPRAVDARQFATQFYEAARGDIDLLVRNGGGMIYLLAGCLAGKTADTMFASPLIARMGSQVKAFIGLLAAGESDPPSISTRRSRKDS
jgi:hypothetical protein